ncbi:helix-turn-helix transcriptional regulator [Mycolicibacterium pulveris]|uniref:helix-turn-helix transcriptional regulator n=1 Tax=Mycolicibacterium pulveris TaxID=36813 RepID=UPI0013D0E6CE|nr:helix-turn-helix transcriptional regulator [Mycolicibacterium pulveris]MCV6978999.1 helix-turn-helix transcriptional regulator [Mycolicibacterium pulveris]
MRASGAAVDRALAAAVSAAVGRAGVPTAGWVTVPRPGRRPYVVRVVPVSATGTPAALVIVVDPDRNPLPTVEALIRRYGLTRTEAEVARRVLDGDGLGPIARERSVSITTIRTHMKHIFEKTGTRRQAELVRLILGATTS